MKTLEKCSSEIDVSSYESSDAILEAICIISKSPMGTKKFKKYWEGHNEKTNKKIVELAKEINKNKPDGDREEDSLIWGVEEIKL